MRFPAWSRRSYSWIVLAVGVLVFAFVVQQRLEIERTQRLQQREEWLGTLALVMERNLTNQLQRANQTLDAIQAAPSRQGLDLVELTGALPGVRSLLILDAKGMVRASNRQELVGTNLSMRPYFVDASRQEDPATLMVSQPFTSALGIMVINATKVLRGPSGEFQGVVTLSFDPDYTAGLLGSIVNTGSVTARLYHGDGVLYLEVSFTQTNLGSKKVSADSDFYRYRARNVPGQAFRHLADSPPTLSSFRQTNPAGVQLSSPLVIEVEGNLEAELAHQASDERMSWMLFMVPVAVVGILLLFLRKVDERHFQQVEQFSLLVQNNALRFQLATEAAHLGVWEWAPRSRSLTWDGQMSTLYGRTSDETPPSLEEWSSLIVAEDRELASRHLESAIQEHHACHRMFRIQKPDGTIRWIQCNARYFLGDGELEDRMIGINEDVTQRVQSATSLMERERFLRLVTESTHAMIAYFSLDEVCLFTNESYARRHGFLAEELVGMTLQSVLGEELYERRREVIARVRSGLSQEFQTEALDIDHNESFLWLHYEPDLKAGQVQGFFIIVDDITELKKARDQLEAQQGKMILNARMAQMGELLNLISHQWRQPLTVIAALVGNVQLRSQLGKLDTEYLLPKLDKITQTVQEMSNTIESFRAFFSPSTALGRTDLVAMTRKALEILSPVLQKSSLEVRLVAPDQVLWAQVLQSELMQVVIEILGNARQALTTAGKAGWISLEWTQQGNQAVLSISNNGGAIPDRALARIFEPYFSTKPEGTGTGMGLYMAKVIVEGHHHGTLTVTCSNDVTSFHISLPLEEASA